MRYNTILEALEDVKDSEKIENNDIESNENEAPSEEVVNNAYFLHLNELLQSCWKTVGDSYSLINTLKSDDNVENKEELLDILNTVTNNFIIAAGLLENGLKICVPKTEELLNSETPKEN